MTARRRLFDHFYSPGRIADDSAKRYRAVTSLIAVIALMALVVLAGCWSDEDEAQRATNSGAGSIADAEGAVCGMVIKDQPAPRAQVVHRDGTRLFLCGIADLMVHLEAPSPHGSPVAIFVEAMEAHEDPREIHLGDHEWIHAQDAIFRIGDQRPAMIMGRPAMVYRDRSTAEKALQHGPVEILDFEEFQAWWRRADR